MKAEICQIWNSVPVLFQTPQKRERQVTPKKTPEKRDEGDEYGGSTDVDEPREYSIIWKIRNSQVNATWRLW